VLRFYAKFLVPCSGIFLVAAALGQLYYGHFPTYDNLAFATILPFGAFSVIVILIILSDYCYPLKVSATGLEGYNCYGRYGVIAWNEIVAVEEVKKFGSTCLYVDINAFRPPFVVPLWLHELEDFCKTVEQYAGKNNPLTVALIKAAHHGN
jgi:hypothetical protein